MKKIKQKWKKWHIFQDKISTQKYRVFCLFLGHLVKIKKIYKCYHNSYNDNILQILVMQNSQRQMRKSSISYFYFFFLNYFYFYPIVSPYFSLPNYILFNFPWHQFLCNLSLTFPLCCPSLTWKQIHLFTCSQTFCETSFCKKKKPLFL